MRVGFDVSPALGAQTGIARYTGELAAALETRGIELRRYAVALRGWSLPEVARRRVPARLAQWSWRRFERPSILSLVGGVDLVHATRFVLPPTGPVPGVVTIHDLGFYRDDTFPGGRRLRDLVPWSAERAAAVLVPTEAVRDELAARLPSSRAKTYVTPEGVAPLFFGATPLAETALEELGIRLPFAVAVATVEPRKNLTRLLEAWGRAAPEAADWTLVLAGARGWGPQLPPAPGVVRLGWVAEETLPGLLAAAGFFCYPSLYEGFGLPPLEAMAAGTAVLAGRSAAVEEVVGDAGLLVDPTDTDALAAGIVRLAGDEGLRRRLALKGRARATEFTWERTARETITAYERVL